MRNAQRVEAKVCPLVFPLANDAETAQRTNGSLHSVGPVGILRPVEAHVSHHHLRYCFAVRVELDCPNDCLDRGGLSFSALL